jgi:hypothetical protein
MTYRLTNTATVVRVADGAHIPADDKNRDRRAFNAWVAAGNTPLPAASAPVVMPDPVQEYFNELRTNPGKLAKLRAVSNAP